MKILEIDYDYYQIPEGMESAADFVAYANAHYSSFVKLKMFQTENCVFPYLIAEETMEIYLNIGEMEKIKEVDATILTKAEYEARLPQVVQSKCLTCAYYEEDLDGDNMKGHRSKLSLDGECWSYQKKG